MACRPRPAPTPAGASSSARRLVCLWGTYYPTSTISPPTIMNSKQTSDAPRHSAHVDLVALLLAAPIALALGAPALGYGLGAAAWIVVRALRVVADRRAGSVLDIAQQVSLRLAYRVARVSVLIAVTVSAFKGEGRADGATALLVIAFAFTTHLSVSIIHRPRPLHWPGRRGAIQALRQSRMAPSPTAAGMTARTNTHGCAERNGGARVAEPAASCPTSTAVATTSARKATAATHMAAGNRQLGGSPSR